MSLGGFNVGELKQDAYTMYGLVEAYKPGLAQGTLQAGTGVMALGVGGSIALFGAGTFTGCYLRDLLF